MESRPVSCGSDENHSVALSTCVPSSANEDDNLTCHADLDWATVKTLTSEF